MDWKSRLVDAYAEVETEGGTVEVVRMRAEVQNGLGDILAEDDRGLSLWGAQVVLDESMAEPFKVYSDLAPAAKHVPAVCPTCERPL